ncbi:MAG TPA: CdaR family protein [Candidatus Limiplasma sp.]|nr:CdaR family protein [Candidatus Limiplasma sp.]
MNREPEHMEPKPVQTERPVLKELKQLFKKLWRMLYHNLPWKLLALVIAICLWAGLITQDPTLTRERVFNDVPVTVTGADTLRRNGMIVLSTADEAASMVRLRVEVPQREYNSTTTANYNPRIDLSKVTETGLQALKISTTSTTTYGTVTEVYPDSINVTVDNYVTSYRLPVTVRQVGEYPTGFYGTTPTLDPSVVSVSGPESIVTQISRVVVDFDASRLPAQAGLVRSALTISYEDTNGNPVDSDLIEASSAGVLLRSIVVEQQLYPTKTLSLNTLALTTGTPAVGYEVKSVTPTPNVLIAAGDETALNALDSLFLEHAVDVTDRNASFTAEVKVRKPSELVYLSADSVMLMVDIGPSLSAKDFSDVSLSLEGTDTGLNATCETKSVTVTVTGPKLTFDSLKASALKAYVSTAGLAPGTYALPVQLTIRNVDESAFTYAITPQNVSVTIAAN